MTVRKAVEDFVRLGPLPDSNASEESIALHQVHLQRIKRPVTDEEAALLLGSFGSDDCYGLAWTLLHLIESAPNGIPIKYKPSHSDNEWVRLLWDRSHR
jgi:hypothetical protein